MATKTCPSCSAEVPVAARRCKECFHDFLETKPPSSGPLPLLIALAGMALVGSATFYYLTNQPTDQKILVNAETRTVQWVKKYEGDKLETEQISFDDIGKLEYVITSSGDFQVVAITLDGERKVVESHPDKPLQLQAERYARMMEKQLDIVDNTFGLSN